LSLSAPLDRGFSQSTDKIDIFVSNVSLRHLLESAPLALGLAEFVLGWIHRSLRASLLNGNLVRLPDHLTNG